MILSWFNTREVDEFAQTLVDELVKRYPPGGKDFDVRKATARLKRTHDSLFARARSFASSASLNTYKIAHLGKRVKWALKEAGYPKEFGDTFTIELVTVVTIRGRKRGA